MSEFDTPTLSAHEVMRFSRDHAGMEVRSVGLHDYRIVLTLRDARQVLWELADTHGRVRLTRFPERHRISFEGAFGRGSEAIITRELFERVITAHRPAIVSTVRTLVVEAIEARVRASATGEEDARTMDDRLDEMRRVIRYLFPANFPE